MDHTGAPAPTTDHEQVDACRLVATDADGRQVDFAALVRAVFEGDEDPDAYTVSVRAA